MIRAFIAIELPAAIQEGIDRETAQIRLTLKTTLVRWVAKQNVHLTLKFLGDVSASTLEQIAAQLAQQMKSFSPFEMSVGGLGVFPNHNKPRVIWIGLKAPEDLTIIAEIIETTASSYGFIRETRPFSPHLTIGRVRQPISEIENRLIRSSLEFVKANQLGRMSVHELIIFRSDLKPSGAVYTKLHAIPLQS